MIISIWHGKSDEYFDILQAEEKVGRRLDWSD